MERLEWGDPVGGRMLRLESDDAVWGGGVVRLEWGDRWEGAWSDWSQMTPCGDA